MLEHIRHLVDAGFAVHLLKHKSKAPAMGYGWSERPVSTYEQLESTYKAGQNLGVRLGKPSRVGDHYLHVIDLDVRVDDKRQEALDALALAFPRYAEYPTVVSGSGGSSRHFYILTAEPHASIKLNHSPGFFVDADGHKHWDWEIELFGTGKQVVLPPSIHPDTGNPYSWETEFDFDALDLGIGPIVAGSAMPTVQFDDLDDEDEELLQLVGPPRGMTFDEIKDTLDALPLEEWCEDRDGWLKVGMALHHETSGSDEGFDLWCEFSAQSTKYSYKANRTTWKSFRLKAVKVTIGSLLKAIKDAGLDFDQCMRKLARGCTYKEGLNIVASYDLMPSEVAETTGVLRLVANDNGRNITKTDVMKDLKVAIAEARLKDDDKVCRSVEQWLANETLRLHFAKGRGLVSFQGRFWAYDGGVWVMVEDNFVAKRVSQVVQQALGADEEISEPVRMAIRQSKRGDTLNALIGAITGLLSKDLVMDGQDPMRLCQMRIPSVVNCMNGELWFQGDEFELKRHNSRNFFTTQVQTGYDNTAECPLWDQALQTMFEDKPDSQGIIDHLHEVLGYIIQPSRQHALWVLFYGQGSNGKSLIAGVLQALMGHLSCASRSLADIGGYRNNHAEAGLVGKLLLVDDDFKKGAQLPDDQLKRLSETKLITANPKGSAEFNFVARTVPMILSNHWPKTTDSSYGLERRAMVFHFTRVFREEEKDVTLLDRIVEHELPGILNHLVAGWLRLKRRGHLAEPVSCLKAKRVWLANRNVISNFLDEHIELTGNISDRLAGTMVWEAFLAWSRDANSGLRIGRNSFYEELSNLPSIDRVTVANQAHFTGLKLINREALGLIVDLLDDDNDDELI